MQVDHAELRHSEASILIVDDEFLVCTILQRWLEMEGYRCQTASGGKEALELLHHDEFQLVLSDIMMPGMDGIALLEQIRTRFPDIAVIMITGLDDRRSAKQALELGAYGYIIKPLERHEILINVYSALERRRLSLESLAYEKELEEKVEERTREMREREEEIAFRLVAAAEYRDDETGAHIQRVGLFSEALASRLGWDQEQTYLIKRAAPMHDIGKIGIPDNILRKPARLDAKEFEIIKQHTIIGHEILGGSEIPLLNMAAEIALYHHEKWDGTGYPQRLKGDRIPQSARLVAVVDVFDALMNDRIYRPALPEEKTLEIMREGNGSHFDPEIFEAFIAILPEFRQILANHPDC